MIKRIIIIVVIQTLILFGMVGMKQYTLNTGTQILLETQPIDPRSLFRGDYVRLRYNINNLELDKIEGDKEFKRYDTIYVHLIKVENYWEAKAIYQEKPDETNGDVIIKGKVKYLSSQRWNRETRENEQVENIPMTL